MHTQLKASFVKVTKIAMPTLVRPQSTTTKPDERLEKLKQDTDIFLKMLVGDQLLCESRAMQHFFRPDGGHTGLATSPTRGPKHKNSTESLKTVPSRLKSKLLNLMQSMTFS